MPSLSFITGFCSVMALRYRVAKLPISMLSSSIIILAALISGFASAEENRTMGDKKENKQESLLEASPSSLRYSVAIVRDNIDRSDPTGMYGYVNAIKLLVQRGLDLSQQHTAQAAEYKEAMLPMSYNLSADTWTGWEDAHDTAEDYRLVGLEAARLNLKLKEDIGQSPSKRGAGHWIIGIHLIAEGQYQDAVRSFEHCRDLARKDSEEQMALMAEGWVHLSNILAGENETDELEAVKQKLSSMDKDGVFLANQFDPALSKFQDR